MDKKPFHEEVAERLIEQLKQGIAPFQRPWAPGIEAMPYNPTTGKRYKGGNSLWLSMQGRSDPRWLTYNQAQDAGAQVRKGQKSTTIEYWKFREEQVIKGEDGKPVLDADGNKITRSVELERPKVFYAKVFNAEQIDGLPPLERKEQTWDAVERAEHILAASGARITHAPGDRAFYRLSTDSITMPEKGQFPTSAQYYAVALHELGHWTGHPSRLDRDLSNPFGSEGYAKEELRAEIASLMLGSEIGIGHDPAQHTAYVASWIKVLQDDPREIFRASADAEKIQNFVLAFEQQQTQAQTVEPEAVPQLSAVDPAPVPQAWLYQACEAFDKEMALSIGDEHYSRARELAHALIQYEEMTFEPSAREQAILDEKKPAMDEAKQWIRENVLLNPAVKEWVYETVRDLGRYTGDAAADKERRDYLSEMAPQMEQKEVLLQLANESENAIAGYRSIESWENLQRVAEEHGYRAVLRWSSLGSEASPLVPQEGPSDVYVQYFDQAGRELPIHTEMGSGDGKAITCLDGRRVHGTGPTSDEEWQRNSLTSAIATMQAREQQQQVDNVEQGHETPDSSVSPEKLKAERWILERTGKELESALGRMSEKQLNTVYDVLDAMHPLSNDNEFWLRHPEAMERMFDDPDTFEDAIFSVKEAISDRLGALEEEKQKDTRANPLSEQDQALAEELMVQRNYRAQEEHDAAAVHRAEALSPRVAVAIHEDAQLPYDWTGGVSVKEQSDGVYAVMVDREGGDAGVFLQCDSADQAARYVDRLRLIDAHAQLDPLQQALKLAAIREDQVARDPASTEEDVLAAKEARKGAEIAATLNSGDLRQRITELEQQAASVELENTAKHKTWLAVPYEEREAAKEAAGKLPNGRYALEFDKTTKCWFAHEGTNLDKVKQWLPQNRPVQERATTPREEFAQAMRDMGLVVTGKHPIMDGARHRVPVEGGSAGNTSGSYRAFSLEPGEKGVPAGTIQNFRTGEKTNWSAKGYSLSDEDRAALKAQAAANNQAREQERAAAQQRAEKAMSELLAVAKPAQADHPYLVKKQARPNDLQIVPADTSGLPADTIIMIGSTAKESKELRNDHPDRMVFTAGDLLVTAQNTSDEVKALQSIRPRGSKMFAKGTEKHLSFHVVGGEGMEALKAAPVIVIGEGYATADTLSQSLGYPTVAAFDSGNLPHVARELHQVFPDKPFLIAGDNDMHQELVSGKGLEGNPGRTKAEEAAKAVGGTAIVPTFAPGEQAYPAHVEPIDPAMAKANKLTPEQQEALEQMKRFTDFNDLATNSAYGREGLDRQVRAAADLAIKRQEERKQEQTRQQAQDMEAPQQQEKKRRSLAR